MRRICARSRAHGPQRGELVVAPTHREVQARRHADHHQPDAGQGSGEVHADGERLRQLRQRPSIGAVRLDEARDEACGLQHRRRIVRRVRPDLIERESRLPGSRTGAPGARARTRRRTARSGTRLGNWLAMANGWTVVLWPATPTSKGASTAGPSSPRSAAGRSGGAGQIPPITFPAPGSSCRWWDPVAVGLEGSLAAAPGDRYPGLDRERLARQFDRTEPDLQLGRQRRSRCPTGT